jgi:urea transporter
METKSENFLTANLIGMGQIMLQENKWTGLLFLIGIWYGSPIMGVAVTLSVVIGTATALLLKYDKGEIYSGLYGFNAALVGAGLNFYFGTGALVWVFIVVASALSTVLMHVFLRRGLPAYTFPFIVLTWGSTYLLLHAAGVPYVVHPPMHEAYSDATSMMSHGFGEVIFQGGEITGLIFFVAIFINSPICAPRTSSTSRRLKSTSAYSVSTGCCAPLPLPAPSPATAFSCCWLRPSRWASMP